MARGNSNILKRMAYFILIHIHIDTTAVCRIVLLSHQREILKTIAYVEIPIVIVQPIESVILLEWIGKVKIGVKDHQ